MLRIQPVYGSRFDGEGQNGGICTLVEYGGVSLLWNVGLTEDNDANFQTLPPHDALLLQDSTLKSLGALPLYARNFPEKPVYSTFPTVKMGQMALYDHHASICLDGQTPPFSLDEMDAAFGPDAIHTIKYSQAVVLKDAKGKPALSITAHRAGHVVGGAFFILRRIQDDTCVVLVGDYNVAKELHLESSTLLKDAATPDVLVCHPGGPAYYPLQRVFGGPKPILPTPVTIQAEKTLVESILAVLRREGNVLLPVDASGRVLELLLLLNQYWDRHRLVGTYNLVWLGPMTKNTLDYAKSQLEWMSLGKVFDSSRINPFALKHVSICSSLRELEQAIENGNPTCVLASGGTCDHGPARDLLLQWADNPDNAILFTDSAPAVTAASQRQQVIQSQLQQGQQGAEADVAILGGELEDDATALVGSAIPAQEGVSNLNAASQLLYHWCQAKVEGREMEDVVQVDVLVPHRAPLKGAELKDFLAQEEAARKAQQAAQERRAMLEQVELAKGQLRLGEEEERPKPSAKSKAGPVAALRPKKKSRFDSSLFIKFSKPLHMTFEVREEAVGIAQPDSTAKYGIGESVGRSGEILEDEYGIAVIPERFTDIVTGVDPSKFSGGSGRLGEEIVHRGFGFGSDGKPVMPSSTGGRPVSSGAPNEGTDTGAEDIILDEQALEAADLSEGRGIIRGRGGRPPTKVLVAPRRLDVLAEVNYVPLEGRVDARAARQSVRALQPRQVVILGGPSKEGKINNEEVIDEVTLLAAAARAHSVEGKPVLTPSDAEVAELKVGHAAYSVRLIDTPYQPPEAVDPEGEAPKPKELHESQIGECTVARFDFVGTGKKVALDGSIVLAPRMGEEALKDRANIYVSDGEVLLTDLRTEIIAQGMKAVYSARPGYSQLVVNGRIIVKRDKESGRVDVEGPLCEDFFKVRSIVCGQYVSL